MPIIMGLLVLGVSIGEIVGATLKNRFSEYDITDDGEEPDPLNRYYDDRSHSDQNRQSPTPVSARSDKATSYCPHCGTCVEKGFAFCPSCGKKLPESTSNNNNL